MMSFIVLLLCFHTASSVTHSIQYFYTASSDVPNFPEFVSVVMLDGVQTIHYDSNTKRAVPTQDWMNKATAEDPQHWEGYTQFFMGGQQVLKADIGTLMQRFNQSGGVHIVQRMCGCSWDEETGVTEGYDQYGYDGEDFLAFDLKTLTWIAPSPKAFISKLMWDREQDGNEYRKIYYTQICIEWLKKYLEYGKSTLKRTVPPSVSLLQKTPSSPVTCHATGFYPSGVMVFWRRDGQEVYEDVEHGEVLPNNDGTFQTSTRLTLKPEDLEKNLLGEYECVVQLSGMEDNIVIKLDPSLINTNRDSGSSIGLITGIIVVALVVVLAVLGLLLWKFRNPNPNPNTRGVGEGSGRVI